MLIERNIKPLVIRYMEQYPIVTITGPRQSGKTTLCKMTFPEMPYVSLENIENRTFAAQDPRGFLATYNEGVIFDEVQRVPELLSYIQTFVDERQSPGQFLLTGSAQFELLDTINQSLAGRTALLRLLPFTLDESYAKDIPNIEDIVYTGFYPRIFNMDLNPSEALSFYLETYIERDVRTLFTVKDLSQFQLFVKLCAGRVGNILNLTSLGNDCGISHTTAKAWLSILQASYVIFLLQPHYNNFSKRLIKAPKLYFYDVGLASYLNEIRAPIHVQNHPLRGALFENFIIADLLKQRYAKGLRNNFYFFRDNSGNEVDLLIDEGQYVYPVEIKSGQTINQDFFKGLFFYQKLNREQAVDSFLIYGGEQMQRRTGITVYSYKKLSTFTDSLNDT